MHKLNLKSDSKCSTSNRAFTWHKTFRIELLQLIITSQTSLISWNQAFPVLIKHRTSTVRQILPKCWFYDSPARLEVINNAKIYVDNKCGLPSFKCHLVQKSRKSCNRKCLVTTVIKYQNSMCRGAVSKRLKLGLDANFTLFDEVVKLIKWTCHFVDRVRDDLRRRESHDYFWRKFFGTHTPSESYISPPFTPSLIYAQYTHLVDHCKNVYASALSKEEADRWAEHAFLTR